MLLLLRMRPASHRALPAPARPPQASTAIYGRSGSSAAASSRKLGRGVSFKAIDDDDVPLGEGEEGELSLKLPPGAQQQQQQQQQRNDFGPRMQLLPLPMPTADGTHTDGCIAHGMNTNASSAQGTARSTSSMSGMTVLPVEVEARLADIEVGGVAAVHCTAWQT